VTCIERTGRAPESGRFSFSQTGAFSWASWCYASDSLEATRLDYNVVAESEVSHKSASKCISGTGDLVRAMLNREWLLVCPIQLRIPSSAGVKWMLSPCCFCRRSWS
jgi:hypothetical protein